MTKLLMVWAIWWVGGDYLVLLLAEGGWALRHCQIRLIEGASAASCMCKLAKRLNGGFCIGSSQVTMSYQERWVKFINGQVGMPAEEDLKNWGQHTGPATVPDHILQAVGAELPGTISFVFTCQV